MAFTADLHDENTGSKDLTTTAFRASPGFRGHGSARGRVVRRSPGHFSRCARRLLHEMLIATVGIIVPSASEGNIGVGV